MMNVLDHPALNQLFVLAFVVYGIAWLVTAFRPALGKYPLGAALGFHLAAMVGRGWVIAYLPLSNKMESFSSFALAMAAVTLIAWRPVRLFVLPLLTLVLAAMATAHSFPMAINYPAPLLITVWYPLHVPLSFVSYALWAAAAAAGLEALRRPDPERLRRVDRYALQGFGVWSVGMIFGGIWGVVAWGAYFMWDPKILWSVILWFHYAVFVHVRLTPSLRHKDWVRPVLALVGVVFVFCAYVGTSFFFGGSSHAF